MEIRAIDTEYDGILFRSRLEARWAIFLDAMRIDWCYEHEGYHTEFGPYLPDFWLPSWQTFLEIKQGPPTKTEISKGKSLASNSGYAFILASSTPSSHKLYVYCQDATDGSAGIFEEKNARFALCDRDGSLCIDSKNEISSRIFMLLNWDHCCFMRLTRDTRQGERLERAIQKAMQARFEHGQTPTKQQVQFG